MSDNPFYRSKNSQEDGEHWLSISDLMSGLMIVFLFISIAFMRYISIEKDKIRNIAVAYQENQVSIYNALNQEFKKDLNKWDATIDPNALTFQFNSPEVLFATGKHDITDKFSDILSDFIPRYLHVLEQYKPSIQEIRIEGHTSSEWHNANTDKAYFFNMKLSQGRTIAVLEYIYKLPALSEIQREWIKSSFAAVGFSSSKVKFDDKGIEDKVRSRRVTFRVITNADIQIIKILEED